MSAMNHIRLLSIVGSALCVGLVGAAEDGAFGRLAHPNPLRHLTNRVSSVSARRSMSAAPLPERYDLRDIDGEGTTYLAPVRNQGSYGTCWAFASMAGLEYLINRDEGIAAELSVNNLANLHGYAVDYVTGGLPLMAVAVFLREEGPVTAALDPYGRIGMSVRERGVRIPRKVVFLPNWTTSEPGELMEAQVAAVKRGVLEYGPLTISYYHHGSWLNDAAYYDPNVREANHAVAVVGWDDDFPLERFKSSPPTNGAFIVRNSWGPTWQENGYFYISYFDRNLCRDGNIAWARLSDGSDYGHVYQHDPYGYVGSGGSTNGTETALAANVFRARADETLSAFGFYAQAENTSYAASVVIDPRFGADGSLSGEMRQVKTGTCAEAGFEVVAFDSEVDVGAGTNFAIVVSVTTPGLKYPIPLMYNEYFDDGTPFVDKVEAKAGLSHFGEVANDSTLVWEDMSADGIYFCCKVYAKAKFVDSTISGETNVPYRWLDAYSASTSTAEGLLTNCFYGAYNALAEHVAANGLRIEQSFARGLDPDNAVETNLIATLTFDAADQAVIGVSPRNDALWRYEVVGSTNLRDWRSRTPEDSFFKVKVTPHP